MKSLAFFALSAIATAAMATGPAPAAKLTISGISTQLATVNGGSNVTNTANSYTYANQNIASNKGSVDIKGKSEQSAVITDSQVTNTAVNKGDVAVQNVASNAGEVSVEKPSGFFAIGGKSEQEATIKGSSLINEADGSSACGGWNCDDAALAYQNAASNFGNVTIAGTSKQSFTMNGNSVAENKALGAKTVAVQNMSSNYGDVAIAGYSSQATVIAGNSRVGNYAFGEAAHAYQNLASNDSCDPPPPVCVGPACGPYQ
ncbi:hypothetical protein [Ottowia sp.]|uniref:hypothetical protein n=1 Tax=Ottowia sp. TaxID=1898956 RepID=UPI003A8B7265